MRINGEWLECDDEVIRPTVKGMVRLPEGQWVEVTFLLDGGADRTVFSAWFLHLLKPLAVSGSLQSRLAGVGGEIGSITVETAIGFIKDDGRAISVRGSFHVFQESESSDLSVLGRDVTNNFGVIYDYPNRTVALLAPPHYCEISQHTEGKNVLRV
jgi:hypothetical protein